MLQIVKENIYVLAGHVIIKGVILLLMYVLYKPPQVFIMCYYMKYYTL